MEIWVFGREECPNCKHAKKNISETIKKHNVIDSIKQQYFDLDTVDGMAEGAFYDVRSVPTTIISDNGENIARWDGIIPPENELSRSIIKD